MADAVLNHMSAESDWFQAFLAGEPPYDRFFRTVDPGADLSRVVRPRTLPLVTTFGGADGPVYVWTTFSADQVDLDYRDPDVLLAALDILLRYRAAGATAIRLDAIAFLWKVEGSPSINLPETHDLIELLRSWLDEVDAGFDDRHRDQRAARRERRLPRPAGSARSAGGLPVRAAAADPAHGRDRRSRAARRVGGGSRRAADGLHVPQLHVVARRRRAAAGRGDPARGRGAPHDRVVRIGRRRREPAARRQDGTDVPYELASTWYSLMTAIDPDPERALARHILSQAFVLALRGIPLLYTHVLLASDNDVEGYRRSGVARDLNRADVDLDALEATMADPDSRAARATTAIRSMLRTAGDVATPSTRLAPQQVTCNGPVVIVERTGRVGFSARVLLNVSTDDDDRRTRSRLRDGACVGARSGSCDR